VIAGVVESEATIKESDALLARPMETKYGETMHLMEQTYREKLTGSRDCCDRALGVVKAGVALLQSELDERIRKDEEVRAELTAGACAQAFAFVEGVENDVATGDVSLATVEHLTALRAQAAASVSVLSERLGRSSPADTRNADHATAVLAALAEQAASCVALAEATHKACMKEVARLAKERRKRKEFTLDQYERREQRVTLQDAMTFGSGGTADHAEAAGVTNRARYKAQSGLVVEEIANMKALLAIECNVETKETMDAQLHEIDEGLQKLNLAARVLEDLVEEMVEGTSSAAKEEAAEGK